MIREVSLVHGISSAFMDVLHTFEDETIISLISNGPIMTDNDVLLIIDPAGAGK